MGNYYLYKLADFLTRYLPLSFNYAFARMLSVGQYFLSKADREAVRENLKVVLKTNDVPEVMVMDVFKNFSRYLVEFFTMTRKVDAQYIKDSVEIVNIEYLNEVMQKGKGGILVGAHLGNWEVAGAVLSQLGYPISAVALAHKDERVNTFFNSRREFFGEVVIQTNVALRRCLEHLRRNRFVAVLADRDFGRHGLKMDFLGKQAYIPQGAAIFALKTGAPLIPMSFIRTPKNGFRLNIEKPIYPPTLDEGRINDQEIEQLIRKYLPFLEEQIRQNPSQWLMFRRFEVQ
jgi:Kdo2-lipid IVA lauroyltransferase/acyltransferase